MATYLLLKRQDLLTKEKSCLHTMVRNTLVQITRTANVQFVLGKMRGYIDEYRLLDDITFAGDFDQKYQEFLWISKIMKIAMRKIRRLEEKIKSGLGWEITLCNKLLEILSKLDFFLKENDDNRNELYCKSNKISRSIQNHVHQSRIGPKSTPLLYIISLMNMVQKFKKIWKVISKFLFLVIYFFLIKTNYLILFLRLS